jgi:predicted glycosyltransferase
MISLGIEKEINSGISIYPNPSNGLFILKGNASNSKLQHVKVLNTMGSVIFSSNTTQSNIVVDIQNSPSGVYFIELHFNSGKEVFKVVKHD